LEAYPAHIHSSSPQFLLQGGVAHCDVPLNSGPTKFLPFSQTYLPGFIAATRSEFRAYFEEHYVQLPLEKGDVVFCNPALFHAAGENTSQDIDRMVNLIQACSQRMVTLFRQIWIGIRHFIAWHRKRIKISCCVPIRKVGRKRCWIKHCRNAMPSVFPESCKNH